MYVRPIKIKFFLKNADKESVIWKSRSPISADNTNYKILLSAALVCGVKEIVRFYFMKGVKCLTSMVKRKIRPYKHDEAMTAILMIMVFIAMSIFVAYSFEDYFYRPIIATICITMVCFIMKPILGRIINSNSYIDPNICTYQELFSKKVIDVWTIPNVEQNELDGTMFLALSNIGETMVDRLHIIINHERDSGNTNYIIKHALKKNDCVYFALSWLKDPLNYIKNITIIDYAGRDTWRSFSGKLSKAGDVDVFPEVNGTIGNKKPHNVYCWRSGLSKKQSPEK